MLKDQRILLGVSGSIAAYKACDLVQRLKEKGAEVRVVMTASAARLVHPNTFAALSGHSVFTDAWEEATHGSMRHIDDARWATLFLIAPCTAHTLAELALGLTGSPLSMTALAYDGPVMVAPAMNTVMLESGPMREHQGKLRQRGYRILPTASGELACKEVGEGKLLTPEEITAYVELETAFSGRIPDFSGRRVLISGGHTEEPLDDVRFLANRSSGKTALAMARAFRMAGAEVTVVLGLCDAPPPEGMRLRRVSTSAEFHQALLQEKDAADVIVMAAAIADFVPAARGPGKWKESRDRKSIDLQPSTHILDELGHSKTGRQLLVGFALETEAPMQRGWEKLRRRNCDFMVVNNPLAGSALGFGQDAVEGAILDARQAPGDPEQPAVLDKARLAAELVRKIASRITAA